MTSGGNKFFNDFHENQRAKNLKSSCLSACKIKNTNCDGTPHGNFLQFTFRQQKVAMTSLIWTNRYSRVYESDFASI